MQKTLLREVADEEAMLLLGQNLAAAIRKHLEQGLVVFLLGDLGAGKTTLCRGVLRGFGHAAAVKSPTYTLVEPYELSAPVYHFDLYRLGDPEELEYMGIRDYFSPGSLCLLEWPSKGAGFLPEPDLVIDIRVAGFGREVQLQAFSNSGADVLAQLTSK